MLATALILEFFILGQINAGPAPEKYAELLRINYAAPHHMAPAGEQKPFPVQRYLALGKMLQGFPESQRVTYLRMLARSDELNEPAILLAEMLIDGEFIRPQNPLLPANFVGSRESFPTSVVVFEGAPFVVAKSSAGVIGVPPGPEDFVAYVEHLLHHGHWREDRFQPLSQEELTAIAERFLAHLRDSGVRLSPQDEEFIRAQVRVPLRDSIQAR